jgi:predicted RNA-binding Zn-ribbon protein involved in translation (DUF1610 family)
VCTASSRISSTRIRWGCPVCITEEHADIVERSRLMMDARKCASCGFTPRLGCRDPMQPTDPGSSGTRSVDSFLG